MSNFEHYLDLYAESIVKAAVNLQPGQRLIIGTPTMPTDLHTAPLVRAITRVAYQSGARLVTALWNDPAMLRLRLQHAKADTLTEYYDWIVEGFRSAVEGGDAALYIVSSIPGQLDDLDAEAVKTYQNGMTWVMDLRRSLMAHTNYSIVVAPNAEWADKIGLSEGEFWSLVFEMARITQPDPIQAWHDHVQDLLRRADYLNAQGFNALHFRGPGTNLTVGLAHGASWHTGLAKRKDGLPYAANFPTEEVFTTPHRHNVEGFVTSTKPLSFRNTIIEDFSLTFKGGKVVSSNAKRGDVYLNALLDSAESVRHLGEVALVPHSSPISQTGILFYNTLFDENAASHLAFGNSYRSTIAGGTTMSEEEYADTGGNTSITHVDFMIGSAEIEVNGIKADGTVEPVMREGEWVFDV